MPVRGPRFIPARAGNTISPTLDSRPASVHPRAGGEHRQESPLSTGPTGSSPRGRGTRSCHPLLSRRFRFIPARAGNTFTGAGEFIPKSVHPRAGGEHEPVLAIDPPDDGSSPRGRGTHSHPFLAARLVRFIPARAGNTSYQFPPLNPGPVHPRAGGEHTTHRHDAQHLDGSSPRGRGTLFSQPFDSANLF